MTGIHFEHPRYVAGETLGRGAQGVVFRVTDREAPERALVAKRFEAGTFGDEVLAGEFALLSRLRVPGLVRAHDLGRDLATGAPFFVEDFVDGPDADEWVGAATGASRAARLAHVLSRVAATLATLHDAGFLHGDLKPPHVRIAPGDRPTVLDLGASVARSEAATGPRAISLGFAAPELLAGGGPSPASDLYALGALAFAIATGAPPIPGGRAAVRVAAPWVPPSVADPIEALIAEHPADRPASARDVLARLGATHAPAFAPSPAPLGREGALARLLGPSPSGVRYLVGPSGMGKSHLAREAWTRSLLAGRTSRFLSFPGADGAVVAGLLAFLCGEVSARPFGDVPPSLIFLDDLDAAPRELAAALDVFRCRPHAEGTPSVIAIARAAPPAADVLALAPLGPPEIAALCRASGVTDEARIEDLSRASGGNPGWVLASLGHVPATAEAAADRARGLSDGATRAVSAIGALGGSASRRLLARAVPDGLAVALAEAARAGLVTRRSTDEGPIWSLSSREVADALWSALGDQRLADRIAALALSDADVPAPSLLALAASVHPSSHPVDLLREAATRARRDGQRGDEASALLALAEMPEQRDVAGLVRLERLGRDAGDVTSRSRVIGWLDEAAERDPRVRPLSLRRLSEEKARAGDAVAAEGLAASALTAARAAGDDVATAFALATVGLVLLYRAEWAAAHEVLLDATSTLARAGGGDDPEEAARLEHNFGVVAVYRGDVDAAIDAFERSLARKRRLGDRAGIRACLRNLGYALTRAGRLDEAARTLDDALRMARSLGQASGQAFCLSARAEVEVVRGDGPAAERFVAEAEALGDAVPAAVRADLLILRAGCDVLAGDGAGALAVLDHVDPVLRESDPLVDARTEIVRSRALLACVPARRREAARAAITALRRARAADLVEPAGDAVEALREARRRIVRGGARVVDEGAHERVLAALPGHVAPLLDAIRTASGAERVFAAWTDDEGQLARVEGADLDGPLTDARARLPRAIVDDALARDGTVHVRARSGGSCLARASAPGDRRVIVVIEHRFVEGRFDTVPSGWPAAWVQAALALALGARQRPRDLDDLAPREPAGLVVVRRGRPEQLGVRPLELEGQPLRLQVRPRRADLRRHQLGDRRQHARAVEQRAQVREARDGAADVPRLAERVLDDAAQVAVVRDDDVIAGEVLGLGQGAQPHVARVVETGEPAAQQRPPSDRLGQLVGDGDRRVEAGRQRGAHRAELDGDRDHAHPRGLSLERPEQWRQEPHLRRVREPQAKGALAGLRVERRCRQRGVHERLQVLLRGRAQPLASTGQDQPAPAADEQRRAHRRGEAP
jgi:tetratricopeptide (TPR) repeat protein